MPLPFFIQLTVNLCWCIHFGHCTLLLRLVFHPR